MKKSIDMLVEAHLLEDQGFDIFLRLFAGGPLDESFQTDEKHALKTIFDGLKKADPFAIAKGAWLLCAGDVKLTKNYLRYLHHVYQMELDNTKDNMWLYTNPTFDQRQIYAVWDAHKYIHKAKIDAERKGEKPLPYKPKRLNNMGPWRYNPSNSTKAQKSHGQSGGVLHLPRHPEVSI